MEDFEVDHDLTCPECGHTPLHSRDCIHFCDDGYIDESEDDPINFYPGESERKCGECNGTGIERWCPSCGKNLSGFQFEHNEDEQDFN